MRKVSVVAGALLVAALVVTVWLHRGSNEQPARPAVAGGSVPSAAGRGTVSAPAPVTFAPLPATSHPGAGPATFSGHVLSARSGEGIAGAELTFSHRGIASSTTTDAAGRFRLVATEPGVYRLATIAADGFVSYAPAWGASPVTLEARDGEGTQGLVVYLEPLVRVRGLVTGVGGAPVEAASVRLYVANPLQTELMPLPSELLTDGAGRVAIEAPLGTLVEARRAGYVPARAPLDREAEAQGELRLSLARGASEAWDLRIAGAVLDGSGEPIAEAHVVARLASADAFDAGGATYATSSEADGAFVLDGLPPGDYVLRASHPAWLDATRAPIAAGSSDVVLRLGAGGGRIAGRVARADGEAPVASFVVVVSEARGGLAETPVAVRAFVDPRGAFVLGPLVAGAYRIRALASGLAPSGSKVVRVVSGETASVALELMAGGRISGQVTDATSRAAIAGARVVVEDALSDDALPVPVRAIATTAGDGRFVLEGVPPGLRSIDAGAPGHHSRVVSRLEVREGETVGPLAVELTPLAPGEVPQHELVGIGAALAPEGDVVRVGPVLAGGGADEAGLVPGDAILAIDGAPVADLDFGGIVQRIRGPEGTQVALRVRHADGSEATLVIVRRRIRG